MGKLCSILVAKMILSLLFYTHTAFANTPVTATNNISPQTYIPPQAHQYIPIINQEVRRLMPDFPLPYYFGALIEHESCISLTHKRCWSPTSELKTSRELGVGFGQLTKAYNSNGAVRFDALSDMRNRHNKELKELTWANIYQRPDLQIRAIILMVKDNYNSLYMVKDMTERAKMADAAYNGGIGGLKKERTACGLAQDCDPQIWSGHVERYCAKSTKPIYGGRSACDINRHHVYDVFNIRLHKYKQLYDNQTKQ